MQLKINVIMFLIFAFPEGVSATSVIIDPCFEKGLFPIEQGDLAKVTSSVTSSFEREGWKCDASFLDEVFCSRVDQTAKTKIELRTDAICETAIKDNFRIYYHILDLGTREIEHHSKELYFTPVPSDTFNRVENSN